MKLARTDYAHHAGTAAAAEVQVLIEEARARARRRRRRIAVAVACAAALATGALAAAGAFPGSRPAAGARNRSAAAAAGLAGAPRYFLYAQETAGGAYGWLQVRESATGKLAARPPLPDVPGAAGYLPPYGLAATGPRSFVAGMMTPADCTTRFFRFRLDDQGRPGALTPVGPALPGTLTAMAASAGGGLIGYAIDDSGCSKGGPGAYLGVLDVHSGQTRQWTRGSRITQLSMSANGRLLAFTHATTRDLPGGGFTFTGLQVRVLPVGAPPGTVAERSRVVVRAPASFSPEGEATVLLSPSGTSFYLCSQPLPFPRPAAGQAAEAARIAEYRTATGKATRVLAAFTAAPSRDGSAPPAMTCNSMALDTSGRFLLVPYRESGLNPEDANSGALLSVAVISTATGARSSWTLRFGENHAPASMTIAW